MSGAHRIYPKPNALGWLIVSGFVIAADQWTKYWVLISLPEYTAVPVIEGWWNWYRSYNTGAAFSFLATAGGWQRWFFVALAIVVSAWCWRWLNRERDVRIQLALALIIGGAIGNVIDRLWLGKVIDFVLVYWAPWNWYYPAFNVADSAISIGAVLLLADSLFSTRPVLDQAGR